MSFRKFGSAPQQGVTEVESTDESITRVGGRQVTNWDPNEVEFTDEDRQDLYQENLGDLNDPTE